MSAIDIEAVANPHCPASNSQPLEEERTARSSGSDPVQRKTESKDNDRANDSGVPSENHMPFDKVTALAKAQAFDLLREMFQANPQVIQPGQQARVKDHRRSVRRGQQDHHSDVYYDFNSDEDDDDGDRSRSPDSDIRRTPSRPPTVAGSPSLAPTRPPTANSFDSAESTHIRRNRLILETYAEIKKAADIVGNPRGRQQSRPEGETAPHKRFLQELRSLYKESVMDVSRGRIRVHLAEFNRVVLERAQKRLLYDVLEFCYAPAYRDEEDIFARAETSLSSYVSAWKNLEFMKHARKQKGYDLFVISTDYTMNRALLSHAQEEWRERYFHVHENVPAQFFQDMEQLTSKYGLDKLFDEDDVRRFGGGTRTSLLQKEAIEEYAKKIAMAVIGGVFLIAPMLVMVLHPGLVASLVTTSVCVFAFGLVMATFLEKPFDVLSGTAAYAAVLVVFIGTGGGS